MNIQKQIVEQLHQERAGESQSIGCGGMDDKFSQEDCKRIRENVFYFIHLAVGKSPFHCPTTAEEVLVAVGILANTKGQVPWHDGAGWRTGSDCLGMHKAMNLAAQALRSLKGKKVVFEKNCFPLDYLEDGGVTIS